MSIDVIFTNEELLYINNIFKNERVHKLEKEDVLNMVAFAREAVPDDDDIIQLVEDVYSKMKNLSEEEWNSLKKSIPSATFVEQSAEEEEKEID